MPKGDTHLLGEVPVGTFDTAGDHVTFLMSNEQQAAGDTYRQKTALVTIDVQHQWSSASGHAARAKKGQSGDASKGSKTTQVPNCCRMIN